MAPGPPEAARASLRLGLLVLVNLVPSLLAPRPSRSSAQGPSGRPAPRAALFSTPRAAFETLSDQLDAPAVYRRETALDPRSLADALSAVNGDGAVVRGGPAGDVYDVVERLLESNVAQWSFVESQLLEPNVNLAMPEIAAPLRHLCSSLEVAANFYLLRGRLRRALAVLERACPLVELLPGVGATRRRDRDSGDDLGQTCYAMLQDLYHRQRRASTDGDDAAPNRSLPGDLPLDDPRVDRRIARLRTPFDHLRSQVLHPPVRPAHPPPPSGLDLDVGYHPLLEDLYDLARVYIYRDEPARAALHSQAERLLEALGVELRAAATPPLAAELLHAAGEYLRTMELVDAGGLRALEEELRDIRGSLGLNADDILGDEGEGEGQRWMQLELLEYRLQVLQAFTGLGSVDRLGWDGGAQPLVSDMLSLFQGAQWDLPPPALSLDVELGLDTGLLAGLGDAGLHYYSPGLGEEEYYGDVGSGSGGGGSWTSPGMDQGYLPVGNVASAVLGLGILVAIACALQALWCPHRQGYSADPAKHRLRMRPRHRRPKPRGKTPVFRRERSPPRATSGNRGWGGDDSEGESDADLSVLDPHRAKVAATPKAVDPRPKVGKRRKKTKARLGKASLVEDAPCAVANAAIPPPVTTEATLPNGLPQRVVPEVAPEVTPEHLRPSPKMTSQASPVPLSAPQRHTGAPTHGKASSSQPRQKRRGGHRDGAWSDTASTPSSSVASPSHRPGNGIPALELPSPSQGPKPAFGAVPKKLSKTNAAGRSPVSAGATPRRKGETSSTPFPPDGADRTAFPGLPNPLPPAPRDAQPDKALWTSGPLEVGSAAGSPSTKVDLPADEDDAAALFADLDRGLDMLKQDNDPGGSGDAPEKCLGGVHWTPLLDLEETSWD